MEQAASAMGTNPGFMMAQIINMIILALMISVPIAFMVYVVRKLGRDTPTQKMLLKRVDDDSYVQVQLNDVDKIDILDDGQAVVHVRNNQKITVSSREGRKLVRKLKT